MVSFWKLVNEVIEESDVLLEVLDSRLPDMTRNIEVEKKVINAGKKLILVLNKADLIGQELAEKEKKRFSQSFPVVFVSTKEHHGTKLLREKIHGVAGKKEQVVVGVLGYPNVGKSSIINVLKGRKAASTSPLAGHTKALQKIRVTKRILMFDTPGVLPFEERDETKHVLIGTKMFSDIKNPDIYACEIISLCNKINENIIPSFYHVPFVSDAFDLLEKIAEKMNFLLKGGNVDSDKTARSIIKDWQTGKIKLY